MTMCAPKFQHVKHTVTFCFSVKMASAGGREVTLLTCILSLTLCVTCSFINTLSCSSVLHSPQTCIFRQLMVDGTWMFMVCIFNNVYSKNRSHFIRVQRVRLLLFLSSSPLFTCSPHSLQREFFLLAYSVNEWSAGKVLSVMEMGCTHTQTKSLYHRLHDWIMKMNNLF